MNKKGGSLTFPSDPLAAMRELSDLDAPLPPTDKDTDLRTYGSTETSNPVNTEGRTDGSTGLRQEVREGASEEGRPQARTEASTPVSTGASKPARKPVSKSVNTSAREAVRPPGEGDFLAAVEAILDSREPLIGGVKATVDMSPELSSRAKRYLADHRGQSTRQLLLALFDAFLTEKGY